MGADVASLGLLVVLWACVRNSISMTSDLREAALQVSGPLPCGEWDCECAFTRQRGCCCAAHDFFNLEERVFTQMMGQWGALKQLNGQIEALAGGRQVAFTAAMTPMTSCFGPFTVDVPIPYREVSLNSASGYNPALGLFTAPREGVYSFSFSVYSNVGSGGERLYHHAVLMQDGRPVASVWEDNRDDGQDSATHTVLLTLPPGGQVYVALQSGRELCGDTQRRNVFSGYLLYATEE
ncbi:cerebellin-2-like [Sardina pilchardus]|uniref:cerebellin-2-like n=1 Tax=Sardina pilchardus TaxID=27697 RepID=UPI002E14A281